MLAFLKRSPSCRTILVEKTDRLYRNLKDYITLDELDLEIHFVKENVVLSRESRSSEKFMHGIKVLMAKNYVDNLGEEVKKRLREKAEQGIPPYKVGLGSRKIPRRITHELAFSNLIRCGHCGCSLVGEIKEGLALLELAGKAAELFEKQEPREKRRLLDFVLSNSTWANGK